MNEDFSFKRRRFQDRTIMLMNQLDKSGKNSTVWKNIFSMMDDKAFLIFMNSLKNDKNRTLFFELNNDTINDKSANPDMERIVEVAKKNNIKLNKHVVFPHRSEDPSKPQITAYPVPVLYITVRRLQQILSKKNSITSDNDVRNLITGTATGASKSSSVGDVQIASLATKNMYDAITEFQGPRADDEISKAEMLHLISSTGGCSLKDLNIKTSNKQSISTAEIYLKAAGINGKFGVSLKEK